MIRALALLAPGLLTACPILPDARSTPPRSQGYAVPLGVPVQVGDMVVIPKKLAEDSRCPMKARCVWAGRVIVTTRIIGPDFSDTADLTLGEPFGTHGKMLALVSARPDKMADREVEPSEYRFTYEMR